MLPVVPIAVEFGPEDGVLRELGERVPSLPPEQIYVLPEYLAITPAGSDRALEALSQWAQQYHHAYTATVVVSGGRVRGGDSTQRYNAAVVVGRHGEVTVLGGKISPLPFETHPESKMAVSAFPHFYRVPLQWNDRVESVVMVICSDLVYWLDGIPDRGSKMADALWVMGNFGRDAEHGARRILSLARESGWVNTTVLSNAGQKPGRRLPLAQLVEEVEHVVESRPFSPSWSERLRILRDHVITGPEHLMDSFKVMVDWTTIPRGRIVIAAAYATKEPPIIDWPSIITI